MCFNVFYFSVRVKKRAQGGGADRAQGGGERAQGGGVELAQGGGQRAQGGGVAPTQQQGVEAAQGGGEVPTQQFSLVNENYDYGDGFESVSLHACKCFCLLLYNFY